MGILDLIHKANKVFTPDKATGERLHPAEVELASFKKRQHLDNVKKELEKFRKKDSDEIWRGTPMSDNHSILKTPSEKHNINLQKNTIASQKNNLLKSKGFL